MIKIIFRNIYFCLILLHQKLALKANNLLLYSFKIIIYDHI